MNKSEVQIDFSVFESEEFNMKVGRVVTEDFSGEGLKAAIFEGEYDLCRVKVSADAEDTVMRLEQAGLPHYFSGSIRRYKTEVKKLTQGKFLHDDIIYEKYDRNKDDLLYKMLVDCWGDYPIGYYRTPYLSEIINKQQEINCVFRYYQKYNYQPDYPNNTIMFMKHNGEYVGFFALNVMEDRLESHIGGILKPYQKFGYFFDMQEYIRRFCLDNSLTYFCFGARNENSRVQSIFRKFGYEAYGTDNVFHIPSMISMVNSQYPTIKKEIVCSKNPISNINLQLFSELSQVKSIFFNSNRRNIITRSIISKDFLPGNYEVEIDHPIQTEKQDLLRIRIQDKGKLVGFLNAYIG
jgi:hypothetical protein